MTTVEFEFTYPSVKGPVPAKGEVILTPTRRRDIGPEVVLPTATAVKLDAAGRATADLDPTDLTWCWVAEERVTRGRTRWFRVVDDDEPVDYTACTELDPTSFNPLTLPVPVWKDYLDQAVDVARQDIAAVAGAIPSQIEGAIGEVSEDLMNDLDAGVQAAATSATASSDSATGAQSAKTAAETARTGAQSARAEAETARTGAQNAKIEAEAARDIAKAQTFAGVALGTAHLDTITTDGIYRQDTAASATVARGYPRDNIIGSMTVSSVNALNKTQTLTINGGAGATFPTVVSRRMAGGVWAGWRPTASLRTDQTAGRSMHLFDEINTRDQVIYNDTGLRDISAAVTWNDTRSDPAKTRTAFISRYGKHVTLRATFALPPGFVTAFGPIFDPGSILTAFRPVATWPVAQFHDGGNVPTLGVVGVDVACRLSAAYIAGWTTAGLYTMAATWVTEQPVPATFPGTAVGVIPNT